MTLHIVRGSESAPLKPLLNKMVAVIGYGNQGHAHALNLRDSGLQVIVANRPDSANGRRALQDGFKLLPVSEAVAKADLVIVALPDEAHGRLYAESIAPHLKSDAIVGFLHGFSIRFGLVQPASGVGVVMIAPKGPGRTLRDRFVHGLGLPCLYALHQDSRAGSAEVTALAWANGIGCARAGIIFTTFADEAETDLFGEQAVLCGGMTWLMRAAFETLVDAGYPPELAYLECCHEVKQIADLVYEHGVAGMMQAISNTAEFGAYRAGPQLVNQDVRQRMKQLLDQVRDGTFARAMQADHENGFPWFAQQRAAVAAHAIEPAGAAIRSLMRNNSQEKSH